MNAFFIVLAYTQYG